MKTYNDIEKELKNEPKTWLITGVAGFIGSHILEKLLKLNQRVVGLDNFLTGYKKNLEEIKKNVSKEQWYRFQFINGDIRNIEDCRSAMKYNLQTKENKKKQIEVNFVLHQAALGSVPRSLLNPIATNEININGFLNVLQAAKEAKVQSFTYASSSSTYGDDETISKKEDKIGKPLSNYAVTKYTNELYANVYWMSYGFKNIGLRYFNVYGPRQDPKGAYAAVIPKWINEIINNKTININGDGETSRDFTYIDNVVQANILSAVNKSEKTDNQVYNIALGDKITLNELAKIIHSEVNKRKNKKLKISYKEYRRGDIKHSMADISKARKLLKYKPTHGIKDGIPLTVKWFVDESMKKGSDGENI